LLLKLLVLLLSKLVKIMRTEKFEVIQRKFSGNLFPDYSSGLWYVYLLTDVRRAEFSCGICSNLSNFLRLMDETLKLAPRSGDPGPTRLVYLEGIESHFQAGETLEKISCFTRAQKEKLIRRANPNWTDLALRLKAANGGLKLGRDDHSDLIVGKGEVQTLSADVANCARTVENGSEFYGSVGSSGAGNPNHFRQGSMVRLQRTAGSKRPKLEVAGV